MFNLNKADIASAMATKIHEFCNVNNIHIIGEIPFDPIVGKAIANRRTIIEEDMNAPASIVLNDIWNKIETEWLFQDQK